MHHPDAPEKTPSTYDSMMVTHPPVGVFTPSSNHPDEPDFELRDANGVRARSISEMFERLQQGQLGEHYGLRNFVNIGGDKWIIPAKTVDEITGWEMLDVFSMSDTERQAVLVEWYKDAAYRIDQGARLRRQKRSRSDASQDSDSSYTDDPGSVEDEEEGGEDGEDHGSSCTCSECIEAGGERIKDRILKHGSNCV